MEFGYRTSTIRTNPFTVTDVIFELEEGDREQIRAKMEELAARRREKQPLEYPSAGSTFKRVSQHEKGHLHLIQILLHTDQLFSAFQLHKTI